ncbi:MULTISPECIES: hypothetical protein [unclassified Mesorhizobium]|nr:MULTISPECIES: hypothetical protein [unclassified Mesorhizobium]MCA0009135.1 hypothetical protein [Mesorhizobium sp. B264B1B]MCA0014468.1 hypothetical protein [Mesorhizobium sp. B294B1A1]MCA0018275.1 hypothetical protein [Mesorhizobium sp. B264B1A]MCA0024751.1 hypothetical protein [Mesorhizobium sp. B263B1A]MCA0033386.1 hypothetical protein [Mesorhizobium sp. B263B2A]
MAASSDDLLISISTDLSTLQARINDMVGIGAKGQQGAERRPSGPGA